MEEFDEDDDIPLLNKSDGGLVRFSVEFSANESSEVDEIEEEETNSKPGIKDLIRGAPFDMWILVIVVFLESFAYFSVTMIFMITMEEDYGMSDVESSSTYAIFGIAISIHSILFGWVVDKLLVRKSMLLHIGLLAISKITLGLFPSRVMLWILMLGPFSFALSMGGTAVMVAIRRYTNIESRSVAFSLRYIAVNVGAFVADPVADLIRTEFVPVMDKMNADGYSLFIAITGIVHIIDFGLSYYWIRDVYVPEGEPCMGSVVVNNGGFSGSIEVVSVKWPLKYVDKTTYSNRDIEIGEEEEENDRSKCSGLRDWMKTQWINIRSKITRSLVGLAVLTFGVLGAKSVFRFLDSLYPLYMARAPFPVEDPSAIPYLSFLTIDPLLVIILTAPAANFFAAKKFHPYWVILCGVAISTLAPFFMIIVQYWAVIAFIVTMSLAEIIWSPMLATYACWFAPQGEEGIYLALSALPVFAAKGGAGSVSGLILNKYCPSNGDVCHSVIWVFVGLLALTSPLILGASYKLVKIEDPSKNHVDEENE